MMKIVHASDGFSAVELLVTLFVAVAFLATAYQLYSAVLGDSGEVRFRAKASNIAYAELRRRSDDSTPGCAPLAETTFTIDKATSGLEDPEGKVLIECRANNLTYVKTRVIYGRATDRKEVQHAIFVAK